MKKIAQFVFVLLAMPSVCLFAQANYTSGGYAGGGQWNMVVGSGGISSYSARTDNCVLGGETSCPSGGPLVLSFQNRPGDTFTMINGVPSSPGALPFAPFTFASTSPCVPATGGAGTIATDPDFHARLVMVTDPCTNTFSSNFDMAETNDSTDPFASDSSMFFVLKTGAPWFYYVNAAAVHAGTCTSSGTWAAGTLCLLKSQIIGKAVPSGDGCNGGVGVNCTQMSTAGTTFSGKATEPNSVYETSVNGLIVYKDIICRKLPIGTVDAVCGSTAIDTFQRTVFANFADPTYGIVPADYQSLWTGAFGISNDDSISWASGGAGSYQSMADSSGNTCSATHCTLTPDTFILPVRNNFNWVIPASPAITITGASPTWTVTFPFTPSGDTIPNPPTAPNIIIRGGSSACTGVWPVTGWSTPSGGPYTVTATVTFSGSLTSCPGIKNIGYADTTFQASAGTTSGTEPNWMSKCQTVGDTCNDGSVTWTNIGNLNGQGPGFDIFHYGPPGTPAPGYSRVNTRLAKVYRGFNEGVNYPASGSADEGQAYTPLNGFGAGNGVMYTTDGLLCQQYGLTPVVANSSASISGTTITVHNSTIALGLVLPSATLGSTLVTISGMTPSAYNGSFYVTGGDGATDFTYSVSSGVGAITVPGSTTAAPANGICPTHIPFTEYFTLHDVGNLLDSHYTEIAPTGGGSNPPSKDYSPATVPQSFGSGPTYRGQWIATPNPAYAVNDAVYGLSDPANLYVCTTAPSCGSAEPALNNVGPPVVGLGSWTGNSNIGNGNTKGPSYDYTYTWFPNLAKINGCISRGANYGFGACSAHSVHGFANEWKGSNLFSHLFALFTKNGFANPGLQVLPSPNGIPGDMHGTDRSANSTDSNPIFAANTDVPSISYVLISSQNSGQSAGYSEFTGMFTDGRANFGLCVANPPTPGAGTQCFYRFAHSDNDGIEADFSGQNNIGTVAQAGDFALWSTDMMGTRGSMSEAAWVASKVYNVGTYLNPTSSNNSHFYDWLVTAAVSPFKSGATEPVWDNFTTTVTDGNLTWTRMPGSCNNPLSQNMMSSSVARYAPGNVTMNIGDVMYPVNAAFSVFVATNAGTTGAGATPTWSATCPNYGDTCVYGGVTLENIGPNDCRVDVELIDLLSAH